MSRVLATEPEEVRIGECECPDTPHAETGDRAWLKPRLSPEGGIQAAYVITELETGDRVGDYMRMVGMVLLEDGLVRWDVQDDEGKPAPFDRAALRAGTYDYQSTLKPIVDRAFELYEDTVMRPLVAASEKAQKRQASASSKPSSTKPSTSAKSPSSSEPETP